MYGFRDRVNERCNCYFSFWVIFCPFTPTNSPKNVEIMKKTSEDIMILHMCTKHDDLQFLRYGTRQTDRRTEKVTYRDGRPTQNPPIL